MRRRQLGAQSETLAIQMGILCAALLAAVPAAGSGRTPAARAAGLPAAVPGDGPWARAARCQAGGAPRPVGAGAGGRGGHCCAGWCR